MPKSSGWHHYGAYLFYLQLETQTAAQAVASAFAPAAPAPVGCHEHP